MRSSIPTIAPAPLAAGLLLLVLTVCGSCGSCGGADTEAPASGSAAPPPSGGPAATAETGEDPALAQPAEPELPDVTFVTDRSAEQAPAPTPATAEAATATPTPDPRLPTTALAGNAAQQTPPDVKIEADPDSLESRVAASPDDVALRRELAFSLRQAGRHAEAVPHFEKILELEPGPRSMFELGLAYSSASRFTEAEAAYLKVLEARPNHPKVLLNLANLAVKRDDISQALAYYRGAIEADPTYLLAHYNLGEMLQGQGQAEQAYAVFLATLELQPKTAYEQRIYNDAVYRVASIALSFGDAEQASSLLTQLIAAEPNHRFAHYTLGQAQLQLGHEDEAQRSFERHQQLQAAAAGS